MSRLIILIACISSALGSSIHAEQINDTTNIHPNFQNVPIFNTGNSLEGLSAFAVIPPYSIQSHEVYKKI